MCVMASATDAAWTRKNCASSIASSTSAEAVSPTPFRTLRLVVVGEVSRACIPASTRNSGISGHDFEVGVRFGQRATAAKAQADFGPDHFDRFGRGARRDFYVVGHR